MDSERTLPARSATSPLANPGLLRPGWRTLVCALLVALLVLVLTCPDSSRDWIVVVGMTAVAAFLLSGQAFEKSLLLTLVIACLMPHEITSHGIRVEMLMFAVTVLLFSLRRSLPRRPRTEPVQAADWTNRWVVLLIVAAAVGAVVGLLAGHPLSHIAPDLELYLEFAIAIVVARSGLSEEWIRRLVGAIVLCTALVALGYLRIFATSGGLARAVSDQQHLLNVAVPVLCAFLLLSKSGKERLIAAGLLLPMIPAIYVTQTRALWLYIPFSVALLAVIAVVRRQLSVRRLAVLGAMFAAVVLVVLGYVLLTHGAKAGHRAIAARAKTLKNLRTDLSLASRVDLGFQAFARFAKHPIWGSGLGDWLHYRIIRMRDQLFYMDFSYMWVLWKLGFIGLIPLLGLYLLFLKRVWFVYRRTGDSFQRCVAAGVFVSFVALLIIGFESGILIIYRFNLVWAALIGVFELWKDRIEAAARSVASTARPEQTPVA